MPFDAGVVGAEHRAAQRRNDDDDEAHGEEPGRCAAKCRHHEQQRQRNDDVIGDALLQAERAGRIPEHELEKPGAEQCRRLIAKTANDAAAAGSSQS